MTAQIITIQKEYRCLGCGQIDVYSAELQARPVHCGQPMMEGRTLFRGGDPHSVRVDLVEITRTELARKLFGETAHEEVPPGWSPAFEVWFLKPGRLKGERIGWMGESNFGWEYRMVAGVSQVSARGHALSKRKCVEKMILALDEG